MPAREPRLRRIGSAALALAVAAGVGLALWTAAAPASGPVDVPWDRVACARCHMLVSDPRFAAQLHGSSGEVLFFDDPGCLLLHRAEHGAGAASFLRDSRGDGWLALAQAGFVHAAETPMDYGFAAVARDAEPDALTPEQALAAVRAAPASGRRPR